MVFELSRGEVVATKNEQGLPVEFPEPRFHEFGERDPRCAIALPAACES